MRCPKCSSEMTQEASGQLEERHCPSCGHRFILTTDDEDENGNGKSEEDLPSLKELEGKEEPKPLPFSITRLRASFAAEDSRTMRLQNLYAEALDRMMEQGGLSLPDHSILTHIMELAILPYIDAYERGREVGKIEGWDEFRSKLYGMLGDETILTWD